MQGWVRDRLRALALSGRLGRRDDDVAPSLGTPAATDAAGFEERLKRDDRDVGPRPAPERH